MDFTTKRC